MKYFVLFPVLFLPVLFSACATGFSEQDKSMNPENDTEIVQRVESQNGCQSVGEVYGVADPGPAARIPRMIKEAKLNIRQYATKRGADTVVLNERWFLPHDRGGMRVMIVGHGYDCKRLKTAQKKKEKLKQNSDRLPAAQTEKKAQTSSQKPNG